jgi:hypothetical protein
MAESTKKKSIVKPILLGLLAVIVVLGAVIQMQPSEFHLERSTVINAPAEAIHPHLNDLQLWQAWSPFVKMDPEATHSFQGPQSGVDAALSWSGPKSGAGTMTIAESDLSHVKYNLDFKKPFKSTGTAQFTLTPEGTGTKVTWSFDGKNDFIGKAISLVMDCEEMMGPIYEEGLATLKSVVEGQAPAPTTIVAPEATTETPAAETPATDTSATEEVPEDTPTPDTIDDTGAVAPQDAATDAAIDAATEETPVEVQETPTEQPKAETRAPGSTPPSIQFAPPVLNTGTGEEPAPAPAETPAAE